MGGSIFVTSFKGGVGKTTVCANLAGALCNLGHTVLVVDGDFGMRCMDIVLGLENEALFDLGDVLAGRTELERAVLVRQARLLADEVLPAAPEGSALLTVGGCTLCDSCTRPQGKPCRRPGAISYSLESLGCDVGAAVGDLWGWKLLWGERTRLPAYLTLVCAVLLP